MAADRILLVSVDERRLAAVRTALEPVGHEVLSAGNATEAAAILDGGAVALVLVDESCSDAAREALAACEPLAQVLPLVPPSANSTALEALVSGALRTRAQLVQLHTTARLERELLASVSHELRSPLNVIIGYLELLREGAFGACSADAVAALGKMQGNAVYLLQLVEEFLDLSKPDRPSGTSVALTPFLREVAESFTVLVRTKPVAFHADIPTDLPAISAEPAKLRVVVQNLLGNAEKFTTQGTISLQAMVIPGGRVAIRVSDTGPGIAREHHEAIFGLFHQLEGSGARGRGVGLGLALARRFARMMGGDIGVESTPERGSTFTVVLPAVEPSMRSAPDAH